MRRTFVFLAIAGMLVLAPLAHRAFATADIEICHVNGANSAAVFDQTRTITSPFFNFASRSVTIYHPGRFIRVDASAAESHLAHGDSYPFAGFPLTDAARANLESLTETWQDSSTTVGMFTTTFDYNNVDLKAKNADCYWTESSVTILN